jgi:hypothetical protein
LLVGTRAGRGFARWKVRANLRPLYRAVAIRGSDASHLTVRMRSTAIGR